MRGTCSTLRADDPSPRNGDGTGRRIEYVWGLRYIDDILMRRVQEIPVSGPPEPYEPFYHITDVLFSTAAVLDGSGALAERVTYDPYGTARQPPGTGGRTSAATTR